MLPPPAPSLWGFGDWTHNSSVATSGFLCILTWNCKQVPSQHWWPHQFRADTENRPHQQTWADSFQGKECAKNQTSFGSLWCAEFEKMWPIACGYLMIFAWCVSSRRPLLLKPWSLHTEINSITSAIAWQRVDKLPSPSSCIHWPSYSQ